MNNILDRILSIIPTLDITNYYEFNFQLMHDVNDEDINKYLLDNKNNLYYLIFSFKNNKIIYDQNNQLYYKNCSNEAFHHYLKTINFFKYIKFYHHNWNLTLKLTEKAIQRIQTSITINGKFFNEEKKEYYITFESIDTYLVQVYITNDNKREKLFYSFLVDSNKNTTSEPFNF